MKALKPGVNAQEPIVVTLQWCPECGILLAYDLRDVELAVEDDFRRETIMCPECNCVIALTRWTST
jgi:ribosomal protein S27AE